MVKNRKKYTGQKKEDCSLKTGHWQIFMGSQKRLWSRGVYSIFELDKDKPVPSLEEVKIKYVHNKDLPLFTKNIDKIKAGQSVTAFDYRIIVKNKVKHLFSSFCFERDSSGVAISVTGYVTDMSEWIKLENKHQLITEQAAEAFITGDDNARVIDANDSALKLTGYNYNEIIGFYIPDFFKKEVLDSTPLRFDLLDKGQVVRKTRELLRKDGSIASVEMVSTKLSDGRYFAIVKDITERILKETEEKEKSEKIKQQLEKANRALVIQTMDTSTKALIMKDIKAQIENSDLAKDKYIIDLLHQIDLITEHSKVNGYFQNQFEQVHPGFFKRLDMNYASLTTNDVRLCAYLRMGMTTKEIALISGVTSAAIDKRRNRLRKKISIPLHINLINFMQTI